MENGIWGKRENKRQVEEEERKIKGEWDIGEEKE